MIEIIKELNIEVSKPNVFQAVVAKQYDMNTRFIKATFVDGGNKIFIDPEATVKVIINALRPDGESQGFEGEVEQDGTVKVPLHSWMLELDGTVLCDISVVDTEKDDNKKLTTTSFTLLVEKAAYGGEDITNDPQYDVIVQLLETCSEAGAVAEEALQKSNEANSKYDACVEATEKANNAAAGVVTIEQNNQTPLKFWVGTQAEYEAISEPEQGCFYIISDDEKFETLMSEIASKAPNGFGLGEGAKWLNADDLLSDCKSNGWYAWTKECTDENKPFESGGMLVIARNSSYFMQIAYDASYGTIKRRYYHDGKWSTWEEIALQSNVKANETEIAKNKAAISANTTDIATKLNLTHLNEPIYKIDDINPAAADFYDQLKPIIVTLYGKITQDDPNNWNKIINDKIERLVLNCNGHHLFVDFYCVSNQHGVVIVTDYATKRPKLSCLTVYDAKWSEWNRLAFSSDVENNKEDIADCAEAIKAHDDSITAQKKLIEANEKAIKINEKAIEINEKAIGINEKDITDLKANKLSTTQINKIYEVENVNPNDKVALYYELKSAVASWYTDITADNYNGVVKDKIERVVFNFNGYKMFGDFYIVNKNYGVVRITEYAAGGPKLSYFYFYNGAISKMMHENPQMMVNEEYLTTEKYMGASVYAKLIKYEVTSNSEKQNESNGLYSITMSHAISDMKHLKSVNLIHEKSGTQFKDITSYTSYGIDVNEWNVSFSYDTMLGNGNVYIELKYTKE